MVASSIHQAVSVAGGTLPASEEANVDQFLHEAQMNLQAEQESGVVPLANAGPPSPLGLIPLSHSLILWLLIILAGIAAYLLLKSSLTISNPVQSIYTADRRLDERVLQASGA